MSISNRTKDIRVVQELRDIESIMDTPLSTTKSHHILVPPPTDFSGNLISEPGNLKLFMCETFTSEPSQPGSIQTVFYDTSGVPTGSEPVLFGILQNAGNAKPGGDFSGTNSHDIVFPNGGLRFENGIGVLCNTVLGNPVIENIAASFYYV